MKLIDVESMNDLREGDTIVITGDTLKNEPVKIQKIKVSKSDGTEVIFDMKQNRFFNLGMYLQGQSWVKELKLLQ